MNDQPTLFPDRHEAKHLGPVECLGMTFPNDEERRKHFLEKLRGSMVIEGVEGALK